MTWVKVCGLTTRDDVEAAVEAGADAVGFVLADESRRKVSVEQAAALARGIPAIRVLVTVDMTVEEALGALKAAGADGLQPYGRHADEVASAAGRCGVFVLRPVAVRDVANLEGVPPGQIPLLDTYHDSKHGGTGVAFDWSLAADVDARFVLAGGLGPDNVADAIRLARPWGVDASSKLESAPGKKAHGKVARFVEEAKGS